MAQPTAIAFERTTFTRKFSTIAKSALIIDERLYDAFDTLRTNFAGLAIRRTLARFRTFSTIVP